MDNQVSRPEHGIHLFYSHSTGKNSAPTSNWDTFPSCVPRRRKEWLDYGLSLATGSHTMSDSQRTSKS